MRPSRATALLLPLLLTACASCASSPPGGVRSIPTTFAFDVNADEASPLPAGPTFTVGTYNLHSLRNRAGLKADLAALDPVQVWCFQEVRLPEASDLPHAAAAALAAVLPPGRWHCAAAPANWVVEPGSSGWEAQVVASRFPIASAREWLLDDAGYKRRVALATVVEVGGADVLVVNTDHEPSYFALRDGNARQAASLVKWIEKTDPPHLVVAGDFNCSGSLFRFGGNAGHIRSLDEHLRKVATAPPGQTSPTFRFGPLGLRLDRIYTSNLRASPVKVSASSEGSDHRAVWCELTLEQN